MNQLDIDPTELRGIGIQINKLESRTVKGTGRIENFILNMKSEPKKNPISLNENIDCNKIKSLKISKSKSHQSSSILYTHNTEIMPTINKSTIVTDFFKPKKDKLSQQPHTSKSTTNIPHQSLIKMSQVDPEFLDALPTDLRQEIENELKANEQRFSESIEHKDTAPIEVTMTEESSKLYQYVHVDQMKEFVEEWVATENEPKTCDNIMVSEYLCNLIKDTKTEDAYEIIRKLYR